jgi:apolipoprotein N-acyltransferase
LAKKKRTRNTAKQKSSPRPWWLWAVAAAAVILVVGGLTVLLTSNTSTPEDGTPKVAVDQPVIDEGYVKLDETIRTSFTLRNEGAGTLRILDEPQVELVEGC